MSTPHFELIRTETIPTLHVSVEEYRDKVTSARHIHLNADDDNNCFLVAFLTVPQDSSGVAHILEHTALCGSERYPVRDPFFMMIRRSLNNFMNAFTSSDWTAYPFSTQNKKDFDNLLNVYLDAAFFPTLDALDFAQEGHRVEFADNNTDGDLEFKGVVFNEMKGAMSSPTSQLFHTLAHHLFPTTTYHYNSGGEPADIPNLTHQQLKDFHAKHYHPSNAIFMTYGDISASQHQADFQEKVLSRFGKLDIDFSVPDEQRFTEALAVEESYAIDEHEDTAQKTHVVVSWLLNEITDIESVMTAFFVSKVLLDNGASPLRYALETTDLGAAPSPLCGVDDSSREMLFACGLEGSEPERAQQIEDLILSVLQDVATNGVDYELQAAALHQLELSRREVGGDHYPYGLGLILSALGSAIHGGDAIAALAIDPILEDLQEKIKDPGFIQNWVQHWLIDNPHRVRLTMKPDPKRNAEELQTEQQRLAAMKAAMGDEEKQQVIDQSNALAERQAQEDDPDILPKVGLQDVAPDFPIPTAKRSKIAAMDASWYAQATNGLVYQQLVIDLPEMNAELLQALPLFAACLTEVGCGGRDYLTTQALAASVTGGVHARCSVRSDKDDITKNRGVFIVSGKALVRNQTAMSDLLLDTLSTARFDELSRLRELVAQIRAAEENSITASGHAMAMTAAAAGMSPVAAQANVWHGPISVTGIKQLDDSLDNEQALRAMAEQFKAIQALLVSAPRQFLLIGEGEQSSGLSDYLAQAWSQQTLATDHKNLLLTSTPTQLRQAWSTSTQVNFCAKAYAAVPSGHADAPVFNVLTGFLRNGFLHSAIREKGGAYGGGASFDGDAAALRFYSYRDPRLTETLSDFDRSIDWLLNTKHDEQALEEAILGVVSSIDKPHSPAGTAKQTFYAELYGRTAEHRRQFRNQILKVSIADLQRVGEQYLKPETASIAVVGNSQGLSELVDGGFEMLVI